MSLPKPYYQDDAVTIYHGDCREILPYLPIADCIVTDPPYGMGGYAGRSGKQIPIAGDVDVAPLLKAIPHSPHRFIWCNWVGISTFLDVFGQPDDWIVWAKPWPSMGGGYRSQHEFCLHYGPSPAVDERNLWSGGYSGDGVSSTFDRTRKCQLHPTQKPISLIERPIKNHSEPGGLILDPFMGSGTTLRAAKDLGRRAIGIEIEEKYCEIAAKRMQQEVLPL